VILVGNGAFGAQNLLNAYIAKFYPVNSRGTAVGWALGIGRSGGFVSPNLIGLFLFWHVPLQWSFYALAIPGALSVVLLLFMPKTPMLNEQVGASTALSASTEVS
jgi:AAHS family benzoate transporter-like MFS transporter